MQRRLDRILAVPLAYGMAAAVLAGLLGAPRFVSAQVKTWTDALVAGLGLQRQGHYAEAERELQSALDLARTSSDPAALPRAMNYLGVLKQIRGDYPAADALYRKAFERYVERPAPLDMAAVFLNQARLYGAQGRLQDAEAAGQNLWRPFGRNRNSIARVWPTHWMRSPGFISSRAATAMLNPAMKSRWRSVRKVGRAVFWP